MTCCDLGLILIGGPMIHAFPSLSPSTPLLCLFPVPISPPPPSTSTTSTTSSTSTSTPGWTLPPPGAKLPDRRLRGLAAGSEGRLPAGVMDRLIPAPRLGAGQPACHL